jgi:capsular polysaccharide transport system permease protein
MHAIPELDHIFKLMYLPLYYISGALLPLSLYVPTQYQYFFVANPIVNGLEMMRHGFLPSYHPLQGTSLSYLYAWALGVMFIGLALYKRYSRKLVMR